MNTKGQWALFFMILFFAGAVASVDAQHQSETIPNSGASDKVTGNSSQDMKKTPSERAQEVDEIVETIFPTEIKNVKIDKVFWK